MRTERKDRQDSGHQRDHGPPLVCWVDRQGCRPLERVVCPPRLDRRAEAGGFFRQSGKLHPLCRRSVGKRFRRSHGSVRDSRTPWLDRSRETHGNHPRVPSYGSVLNTQRGFIPCGSRPKQPQEGSHRHGIQERLPGRRSPCREGPDHDRRDLGHYGKEFLRPCGCSRGSGKRMPETTSAPAPSLASVATTPRLPFALIE